MEDKKNRIEQVEQCVLDVFEEYSHTYEDTEDIRWSGIAYEKENYNFSDDY